MRRWREYPKKFSNETELMHPLYVILSIVVESLMDIIFGSYDEGVRGPNDPKTLRGTKDVNHS